MASFDFVLVGGGLQNGLAALALAAGRPGARVALVERGRRLGGNHTWCFHAGDVSAAAAAIVAPLVIQRWPGYGVRFPSSQRDLTEPYAAVSSERLHDVVGALAGSSFALYLGESARHVEPHRVTLGSGRTLEARFVIDARGPDAFGAGGAAGFQKFVGLELEVAPGSAPALPTVMDARVPQRDGFRFFYVLPLSEQRVLVEDTYFSDSPRLDRELLRAEIKSYAAAIGLRAQAVVREEAGVLPLPTRPFAAPRSVDGLLRGGYQGGWFHPTTGYSFPLALRLAEEVARGKLDDLAERVDALARRHASQQRYCTLLNRMLFGAFEPEHRFGVLERFYRLPTATVRRFYALDMTPTDRLRILCGRPPAGLRPSRLLFPATGPRHDASLGGNP